MTVSLPAAEWTRLGVKTLGGGRLPKSDVPTALVSGNTRHFLVSSNYDALLQYNCAHSYALSVALLGDRLAAAPPKKIAVIKTLPAQHARTQSRGTPRAHQ